MELFKDIIYTFRKLNSQLLFLFQNIWVYIGRKQIIIHVELHSFVGERPLVVMCVCESVTALCSVWRGLNLATCLANHSAEDTLELPYNHVCL